MYVYVSHMGITYIPFGIEVNEYTYFKATFYVATFKSKYGTVKSNFCNIYIL
jgi:hypothetical protein